MSLFTAISGKYNKKAGKFPDKPQIRPVGTLFAALNKALTPEKLAVMKIRTLFALLTVSLAVAACDKYGKNAFRGNYSFKTGGSLEISGKVYDIKKDTVKIDTIVTQREIAGRKYKDTTYKYHIKRDTLGSRDTSFVRRLVAESGQMHILDGGGDKIKLTMNITGGDPVVFDADVDGGTLVLHETRRSVAIRPDNDEDDDEKVNFMMNVGGKGEKFENMILFRLEYKGKYSYDGLEGNVSRSAVDCISRENE